MVQRGRKSTGGELLTPLPTFTESLLMEILVQVMKNVPDMTIYLMKKAFTRAGFTEKEIEERLS